MMNEIELQEIVQKISMDSFNKPFKHHASFNSRLRTTGGRYHLQTHDLDFNPRIFSAFDQDVIEGIIKHELCHYHLHIERKGYRHADVDFKELLVQVGGMRYTPSLERKEGTMERWEYECKGCKSKVYRKRRFNLKRYLCSKCNNHFKMIGRVKLDVRAF